MKTKDTGSHEAGLSIQGSSNGTGCSDSLKGQGNQDDLLITWPKPSALKRFPKHVGLLRHFISASSLFILISFGDNFTHLNIWSFELFISFSLFFAEHGLVVGIVNDLGIGNFRVICLEAPGIMPGYADAISINKIKTKKKNKNLFDGEFIDSLT